MKDPRAVTDGDRLFLHRAAIEMHQEYAGIFGVETVEQLLVETAEDMARRSTVFNQFRGVLWVRFARERLAALAKAEGRIGLGIPAVLFLCVHNAGRSQMAFGWFTRLAGSRAMAWSGGSEPIGSINGDAVAAMAEVGVDISDGFSKPWTMEALRAADVVVTMGCGDACPLVPGKKYEDWEVDDPAGRSIEEVRTIRDEIGLRVVDLLGELGIEPDLTGVANWAPRRTLVDLPAPAG